MREFESSLDAWMLERANDLLDQVERLERRLFRPAQKSRPSAWQPPVDIFETPDEFVIVVALPGVDPARAEIVVEEQQLVVRGMRSMPPVCHRAILRRMELPCGCFERWIDLPAGRYEPGEKHFVNGCLVFTLRKLR